MAPNSATVKLEFKDPEKFTDLDVRGINDPAGQGQVLAELTKHLSTLARVHLPAGHTLAITFTP